MKKKPSSAQIREILTSLGPDVVSVLLARPDVEVGGEKLRIAAKNVIQAIEGASGDHAALVTRLRDLEMNDFQSAGIAFFSAGGEYSEVRLNSPPVAMAAVDTGALWLPVVADASNRASAWAVVVDQKAPKLFRVTSRGLEDYSSNVDLPDFEAIRDRREPQLDVLFHSTSSGNRTPGHGGFAKFHALGTSGNLEAEKTEDVFYREVADAVHAGLPRTAGRVFLVGDERGVGRVKEHLAAPGFDLEHVTDAGDGSDEGRLSNSLSDALARETQTAELQDLKELAPSRKITSEEIVTAGKEGRVEKIWVATEATGLREFVDDEYYDVDHSEAVSEVNALQQSIAPAIETGATITVVPRELLPEGQSVLAASRY